MRILFAQYPGPRVVTPLDADGFVGAHAVEKKVRHKLMNPVREHLDYPGVPKEAALALSHKPTPKIRFSFLTHRIVQESRTVNIGAGAGSGINRDKEGAVRAGQPMPELIAPIKALLAGLGFSEDIVMGVTRVFSEDNDHPQEKPVAQVWINGSSFESVDLLKGGKILAVLLSFTDQLPPEYDWRFVDAGPKTLMASLLKHSQLADTLEYQMAKSGVERLGEAVLSSPVAIDLITAFWATKMLVDTLGSSPDPGEMSRLIGQPGR